MRAVFILFFITVAFFVNAEPLIESYRMENDRYIFQLTYRCLDEHVKRKSNAIDPKTSLPVSVVSDAYVALPFTLNVTVVGIQYIGNILDYGAGMHCYYDRQTGKLLAIASINSEDTDNDHVAETNGLMKPDYNYQLDDIDITFGIKLNYDEFIKRVKGLSDEEKLALTKAVK